MFKECGRQQTTEAYLYHKLTNFGSGELISSPTSQGSGELISAQINAKINTAPTVTGNNQGLAV